MATFIFGKIKSKFGLDPTKKKEKRRSGARFMKINANIYITTAMAHTIVHNLFIHSVYHNFNQNVLGIWNRDARDIATLHQAPSV